jgi:hypothetical protein
MREQGNAFPTFSPAVGELIIQKGSNITGEVVVHHVTGKLFLQTHDRKQCSVPWAPHSPDITPLDLRGGGAELSKLTTDVILR